MFKIRLNGLLYWVMAFLICASNIFIVWVNDGLQKIVIVLVNILGFLMIFYQKKGRLRLNSLCISYGLFMLWALLSNLWSEYKFNYAMILVFGYVLVTMITFSNLIKTERQIIIIFKSIMICAVVLIVLIVSFYGITSLTSERMSNELLNANTAGRVCASAFFIALFMWYKYKKNIYLVLMAIYLTMLFLTGSKGALLQMVINLIAFLILKDQKQWKKFVKNVLKICILGFIMYQLVMNIPMFYNIIGQRLMIFLETLVGTRDLSNSGLSTISRSQYMLLGLELFSDKPIMGYGLDMYRYYNPDFTYAHSTIIEIAADLGIVGLILFYYPVVALGYSIIKNKNRIEPMWFAFLVAYYVGYLFNTIVSITWDNLFQYVYFLAIYMYVYKISDNVQGSGYRCTKMTN